ncbi:MAG: glycosyltransferase family 2 protein [Elusimicrobiaceae bacterium]|jgi:uncharacterized protein|nr:glycosyltransferase family 2 protein [Elusimicrobiaceae bacterium]MBT3954795.1 glycosyltransferase family 2 protein [Elusimicrobiaceae bacterium]MBT4008789.1 glycosyltransferase family 2 protein [Elusimicrobiaceae bacterium]MBT4402267.1 glycosyltransferase family 2 protein [Elusimicrobiaceae bacterium]MBT4440276.1 glycosyltransferase family 2 protein [Elusimicrobiaceae bacterium]
MRISVIIPTFNEQDNINKIIDDVHRKAKNFDIEIIVSDSTENQETLKTITNSKVKQVPCEKGRGTQMNKGAEKATGDILLFLHADSLLADDAFSQIATTIKKYPAGAFEFGIENATTGLKIIEYLVNLRNLITNSPCGDQGFFMSIAFFNEIGGFKDIPLLEDLDIMKRIPRKSFKIVNSKILTSARRWQKHGIIKTTAKNLQIRFLYLLDSPPEKLYKLYYGTKYDK